MAWTNGSSGEGEKWRDLKESFWKCDSILSHVLGVGGKGNEVTRMTPVSGSSNEWIVDNLY